MRWLFKKREPQKFETLFGVFERTGRSNRDNWDVYSRIDRDTLIPLAALDANGVPSPDYLAALARILDELGEVEHLIGSQFEEIVRDHKLDAVIEEAGTDYMLSFSCEEGASGESVFFTIVDGKPTTYTIVDLRG